MKEEVRTHNEVIWEERILRQGKVTGFVKGSTLAIITRTDGEEVYVPVKDLKIINYNDGKQI